MSKQTDIKWTVDTMPLPSFELNLCSNNKSQDADIIIFLKIFEVETEINRLAQFSGMLGFCIYSNSSL